MVEPTEGQPSIANTGKRDYRQEVTDKIVAMIEKGTSPWQRDWDAGGEQFKLPTNPHTGRDYRGGNALNLLIAQMDRGFTDNRWLTFKQAAAEGYKVHKGAKAEQVEFWEFPKEDPKVKRTTAATPTAATGVEAADDPARTKPIHRTYNVFNGDQIDGLSPLAEGKTWFNHQINAEAILKNSGASIKHAGTQPVYNKVSDKITLPAKSRFKDAPAYYGAAIHELGHWTGHPSRQNRQTLTDVKIFGDPSYAKEELRAELASVFVLGSQGIKHDVKNHAAYMSSWVAALKDDKNEIFKAAKDAHKIADVIGALRFCKSYEAAIEYLSQPKEPLRRESSTTHVAHEPGSGTTRVHDKGTATDHRQLDGSPPMKLTPDMLQRSLIEAKEHVKGHLGQAAKVFIAHKDSGKYAGEIIGMTGAHVIQRLSPNSAVAHIAQNLGPATPSIGANVAINYSNNKATVKQLAEPVHSRGRGRELGR